MAKEKPPVKETAKADELQTQKKKLPIKVIIIVLLVVVMEVSTVLIMKMTTKPDVVEGDTPLIDQTAVIPEVAQSEVLLVEDMSVDNWTTGKTKFIISYSASVKVEDAMKEKIAAKITQHNGEIRQGFSHIIGQAEPALLKDPKREVIIRNMKAQLESIVGEGVIKDLIIFSWSAMPVE